MKKKIISFMLAICLIIPCAFLLTACKEDDPDRTMDISINPHATSVSSSVESNMEKSAIRTGETTSYPELTFVVNSKDKIVSVMFKNSASSQIYANIDFIGLKADAATKLIIENAVVTGNFSFEGQEVKLEVNGSTDKEIEKLENLVKEEINEVCASLGVEVTVNVSELTEAARKQALVVSAMALAPEKTEAELNAMKIDELIELIKDKQNQFKGLVYGQIETIKSSFSTLNNTLLQEVKNARESIATLEANIANWEEQLNSNLIPDGMKQTIKQDISRAKESIKTALSDIDTIIKSFEEKKQTAINNAKERYSELKEQLVSQYNTLVESAKNQFNNKLDNQLSAGKITQEQYDYWKNLTNK